MAITYRSISASSGTGLNSVTYRSPATVEPDDLILWFCVNKYPPTTPATPTDHSLVIQVSGGDGVAGPDTGDVTATWFSKVAVGDEDGTTQAIAITGGNSAISRSVGFGRDGGTGWSVATASAVQTTASNTWALTTGSLDLVAGDVLVIGVAKNSDQDLTHNYSLSASGITFGTVVSTAASAAGTTNGDDVAYHIAYVPITAGNATVPVNITVTMSGSSGSTAGVITLLRLRESGAAPSPISFSGTVPTLIGKQGTSFSQSVSSYFSGSLTPFSFAIQAGTLPSGLSLNTSTGEISGTPTGSGTSLGIVIRGTDSESNIADTNSFAIALEANPITDSGFYTVASSGNSSYEHTTASHSFWHDGSWWTMLRAGATNWNLYKESGNVPATAGDTVDWVGTVHLTAVHTSPYNTVIVDSARNKAYVLGFGGGQLTVNMRVLTYSAGSWSVSESFNAAGTAGVGVGTGTTFANQSKLSLGLDPNGVPYIFAGNPGSGANALAGCHIAWPNNASTLSGTWSYYTIDSGGVTEGDASGRFAGVISQGGIDYIVVCYTDDTNEKVKMAYHPVETTLSNYSSGWTVVDLETTLSVDNHVWAGVMNYAGDQVVVTAVKDGDGAGAGQLQLITSQLGSAMTWTHKRHQITNGIADPVPVQESPSRPSCVLDNTTGDVWVFYHSRDSHPYGWVGYKKANISDLLAASTVNSVFDISAPRNSVVGLYDASLNATWNAKTPAHPVTSSMQYFPVTAASALNSTTGDSVVWNAFNYTETASVESDTTCEYFINQGISSDLAQGYDIRGFVSADVSPSYVVYSSAMNDVLFNYNINTSVVSDKGLSYSVRSSVESDLYSEYNVLSANSVANSFTAGYNVRTEVLSSSSTGYNILEAVSNAISSEYSVRSEVQVDLDITYQVLSSLESVQSSFTAAYNIVGRVQKDLVCNYTVFGEGGVRTLKYIAVKPSNVFIATSNLENMF